MPIRPAILFFTLLLSAGAFAQTKHKVAAKPDNKYFLSSVAAGQKVYTQYCVTCHQTDGMGIQNMNPPLSKTTYALGDKTKLIKIVLNGFNEDVEINGQSYSNNMPSHDFLTDKEIADVLTYVRNNFGNKASAVKLAEVQKVRGPVKKK